VPATSTLSHPTARKSKALNIACDSRYNTAGPAPVDTRGNGEGGEHDRDLADGGVGQQTLDVGLTEGKDR